MDRGLDVGFLLPDFLVWLRNGASSIVIDAQDVEIVNLSAEQLRRAELLESLHDLGAGGDEGAGVSCLLFCLIFLGGSESLSFSSTSLVLLLSCCYH